MQRWKCLLILLVFVCSGKSLLYGEYLPEEDRRTLTKFSHKIHFEKVSWITCGMCHGNAAESMNAGDNLLPTKKGSCAQCHNVQDEHACEYCHTDEGIRRSFANPERELIFPHNYHMQELELSCQDCHGNMAAYDYSIENPDRLPAMIVCATCHNERQAVMECAACHTREDNLRPAFHTANFITGHRFSWQGGDRSCQMCHQESFCESCHEGAVLTAQEGETPVASHPAYDLTDRGKESQIVQRQHELNYRFLHQLDASGKERRCVTCHEYESFCLDCHITEGLDVKPEWHNAPDWLISLTEGGRHAEYARRDIERCMACHEILDDQTFVCTACHTDVRLEW